MCTLSWWISQEERGVLFNRDEKRTRSRGLPPRIVSGKNGNLLMPLDPDAGGTWIGTNQTGLIVALLNNYPHYQDTLPGQLSRGQLVLNLLKRAQSTGECMAQLSKQDVSRYRGFLLFAMDTQAHPQAAEWAGESLIAIPLLEDGAHHMLTTSSVRREECETYRQHLFCHESRAPDSLRPKHQYFHPNDPALGPLMVREDAATDSIVEIRLGATEAEMSFQAIQGTPPTPGTPIIEKIPLVAAKR